MKKISIRVSLLLALYINVGIGQSNQGPMQAKENHSSPRVASIFELGSSNDPAQLAGKLQVQQIESIKDVTIELQKSLSEIKSLGISKSEASSLKALDPKKSTFAHGFLESLDARGREFFEEMLSQRLASTSSSADDFGIRDDEAFFISYQNDFVAGESKWDFDGTGLLNFRSLFNQDPNSPGGQTYQEEMDEFDEKLNIIAESGLLRAYQKHTTSQAVKGKIDEILSNPDSKYHFDMMAVDEWTFSVQAEQLGDDNVDAFVARTGMRWAVVSSEGLLPPVQEINANAFYATDTDFEARVAGVEVTYKIPVLPGSEKWILNDNFRPVTLGFISDKKLDSPILFRFMPEAKFKSGHVFEKGEVSLLENDQSFVNFSAELKLDIKFRETLLEDLLWTTSYGYKYEAVEDTFGSGHMFKTKLSYEVPQEFFARIAGGNQIPIDGVRLIAEYTNGQTDFFGDHYEQFRFGVGFALGK